MQATIYHFTLFGFLRELELRAIALFLCERVSFACRVSKLTKKRAQTSWSEPSKIMLVEIGLIFHDFRFSSFGDCLCLNLKLIGQFLYLILDVISLVLGESFVFFRDFGRFVAVASDVAY